MEQFIRVGDIGTVIKLTIHDQDGIVDLSTASTKTFRFNSATNIAFDKTAIFDTDGTDGILKYQFILGDLNVAGIWAVQAYIEMPSGSWTSGTYTFTVEDVEIQ